MERYAEVKIEMFRRGYGKVNLPEAQIYETLGDKMFFEIHETAFKHACMYAQLAGIIPESEEFNSVLLGERKAISEDVLWHISKGWEPVLDELSASNLTTDDFFKGAMSCLRTSSCDI